MAIATPADVFSLDVAFHRVIRSLAAVLTVLIVAAFTYHAVVITCFGPSLLAGNLGSLAVLLPFHFLLVMFLWSYLSVVLTDPGRVPPNWSPSVELQNLGSATTADRSSNQILSHCPHCNIPRPPRCRHCYTCQRCVLKRNHHCVVTANCVGAFNCKFFILFLLYAFLGSYFVAAALLCHIVSAKLDQTPHSSGPISSFLVFICWSNMLLATFALCQFLVHFDLVARNTTSSEAGTRSRYDMGIRKNFEQVFGVSKRYWFVPWYLPQDLRNLQDHSMGDMYA